MTAPESFPQTIPGLYAHIPFCLSRCRYCSFSSSIHTSENVQAYLSALEREMQSRTDCGSFAVRPPATVFIGGGTPTALRTAELARLLSFLPMPELDGEASIEINPETITREKLALIKDAGINRLSFGVQTFSPAGLSLLGRIHTAEKAVEAIELARNAGFENISADLISAWPGQTLDELAFDLTALVKLGLEHVSCYNLILEPDAPLTIWLEERDIAPVDDDQARDFWDLAETLLGDHGFRHYEISNFAKPGRECAHNLNYWRGGDYAGVGASAHSYIAGRRFANADDMEDYIARIDSAGTAEVFSERLDPEARARECAVFWLRLAEGINAAAFRRRTGFAIADLYRNELPRLLDSGSLEWDDNGGRIKLTRAAYPLADAVLAELV